MWISAFAPRTRVPGLPGMLYLAEFYLPGGTILADAMAWACTGAKQAARAGGNVRFVQAISVPQDESCFATYRAARPGRSQRPTGSARPGSRGRRAQAA